MNRLIALALPLSLALASAPGTSQPLRWPAVDATHRAIFCGHPGHSETTRSYAEALLAELRRLEAAGMSEVAAWGRLRQQAGCEQRAARRASDR
jgi:hypothetical protein